MLRSNLDNANFSSNRNALHAVGKVFRDRRLWLVAALLAFQAAWTASPVDSAQTLSAQLEAVIKRELPPNFEISMQVTDLQSGRVLMEKNPDLPLVPASTMKVATSAAALQVLHPDFVFVTEVLVDSQRGASAGNIYLRGSGDPYLVTEELFRLTRSVKDQGLDEIRGNIIVDDSYFIPGKPLDENEKLGPRAYHAPYSALSLNFNSIKIVVHPGPKPGDPAIVMTDPVSEYTTLKGTVKTTSGNKPLQMDITKELTGDDREIINVEGTIGVQAPAKGRYVNVAVPDIYTGEVFKEFLLREGIRVAGKVVRGKVPGSAVSWVEFPSRPLSIIVYGLNKFSNNFMAEQISLAMGAHVYGAPGTREKGLAVVRKHLLSCGVDEGSFSLSEASGLSRNNRLSASALVRVLMQGARDFSYNSEYLASFGVAGIDGTLKEKFTDAGARRRLRAKTGTLKGITALTGYGMSIDHKPFVFALLINSMHKGTGLIDYGDKIMRAVLDMPFGTR
ncbi:MAG TPA: D-alanyl-D-alanine carboxypeptidase/D-alanyl-D-alanine-endopeptidase [Desulfomonilaceae bacterium]|nr:D-alanyl-D-alanine carboxypeptidase/D-alanyl-D-alanine-endopeptidase [Desulfomonilaceae bacterium]